MIDNFIVTLACPETYDFVLCVDVMEHIEEDEQVLKNFCYSLKTGGFLLISTPSDQGGSDVHHHDHEEGEGEHSFIDEHVRDGYGVEEITHKMKTAGFARTEVYYQYGKPGKIAWRLSMKYPIVMLNASYLFFILLPFYYFVTFPFVLLLNYMDVHRKHKTGTGLIAKAWK
jgi:SAM-dependent methyltransferase